MASNLRVDQITASTTGSVSIGTATFTGGLSGDITGLNVTGVITATTLNQNVSGIVTATSFNATSNITVGDSFINATSIGIGTTTTAGRNAGVGTATGAVVYNSTSSRLEIYIGDRWRSIGYSDSVTETLTYSYTGSDQALTIPASADYVTATIYAWETGVLPPPAPQA